MIFGRDFDDAALESARSLEKWVRLPSWKGDQFEAREIRNEKTILIFAVTDLQIHYR